jgi:hypothetical protein
MGGRRCACTTPPRNGLLLLQNGHKKEDHGGAGLGSIKKELIKDAPTGTPAARAPGCGGRTSCGCVDTTCARSPGGPGPWFFGGRAALPGR